MRGFLSASRDRPAELNPLNRLSSFSAALRMSRGAVPFVDKMVNGLNALKPDMITEATRTARASADRFAAAADAGGAGAGAGEQCDSVAGGDSGGGFG